MTKRQILLAATPFAAMMLPQPALAQTEATVPAASAPTVAVDAAFYSIYDSIIGGLNLTEMAASGSDSIFDGMVRSEPSFADMSRRNPQFKAEFRAAAMPFLKVWMERSSAAMRHKVAVRLSQYFTVPEAREIAQFYGSPLGRKFMQAVSSNMSFDATVDATIKSGDEGPSTGLADADADKTIGRAMAKLIPALTPAEREELLRFSQRPVYRKLPLISKALEGIEQPTMDEFSTPEEREGFGKAVRAVVERAMSRN